MKWIYSFFILLFLFACHVKKKSDVEFFLQDELKLELKSEKNYIIIFSPSGCNTCFQPYFGYLFNFLRHKKYTIISSQYTKNDLVSSISVDSNLFIIPKDEFSLSKKAFLKTQMCLVFIENKKISQILEVDEKNIKKLDEVVKQ